MNNPLVVCLGEILEDLLAEQSDRPFDRVTSWKAYTGGASANVACASVKLGTPSAFIGRVGRDSVGDRSIEHLNRLGVDTSAVQYDPIAPTRQIYVTRTSGGERHFAGFGELATTDFADTKLDFGKIPLKFLESTRFLVIGTLGLAYPNSREAIERAVSLAREQGVKVFLDINWRPVFWENPESAPPIVREILPKADLVKCSDEEAEWLFGTEDTARISREFPNLRGILVTAGERGCRYRIGENEGTAAAFPVTTVDTTGAGDGFSAGFLHQCGQFGEEIFLSADVARKAIVYASAVGALVTTGEGAIDPQPSDRQVREFLQARGESIGE